MEQKRPIQSKQSSILFKQIKQKRNQRIIAFGFLCFVTLFTLFIVYFPTFQDYSSTNSSLKVLDENKIYLDQQRFFKQYTRFLRRKHGAILITKELDRIRVKEKNHINSYVTFLLEFRVFDEKLFLSTTKRYAALFNSRLEIQSKEIHLESTKHNYVYEIDFIKEGKIFIQITVPYKTVTKKIKPLRKSIPSSIINTLQDTKNEEPIINGSDSEDINETEDVYETDSEDINETEDVYETDSEDINGIEDVYETDSETETETENINETEDVYETETENINETEDVYEIETETENINETEDVYETEAVDTIEEEFPSMEDAITGDKKATNEENKEAPLENSKESDNEKTIKEINNEIAAPIVNETATKPLPKDRKENTVRSPSY